MAIVSICEQHNWTYQEYLSQPHWFLEILKFKKIIDKRNEGQ